MKLEYGISAFIFAAAVACTPAESQSSLKPDTRLKSSFGMLSNVVELNNGQVVFADTRDKLFLRADLKSGRVDTLGRRVDSLAPGAPAGDYKFPGWVARLAADTVAWWISAPFVPRGGMATDVRSMFFRSRTCQERLRCFCTTPSDMGTRSTTRPSWAAEIRARSVLPDSIPVLRVHLKSGKVDTIAQLAAPELGDATFGEQVQQAAKVFAPNDHFGVLPDGTAWVARGHDNRVDWRAPDGTWRKGETRKYTKLPVTQADKDRVLVQVREQGKQYGMPQDLRIDYPFAESKPPFDFALSSPSGDVWLQRPRAKEDSPLIYDVVDRQGKWRREVAFPAGATLAGFGRNGAVYASVKTDDGKRTVGRFRLN